MNKAETNTKAGPPASISRRQLLAGAAATGGALMIAGQAAATPPPAATPIADPELRMALEKYGGEFGQAGKGGSDGDL